MWLGICLKNHSTIRPVTIKNGYPENELIINLVNLVKPHGTILRSSILNLFHLSTNLVILVTTCEQLFKLKKGKNLLEVNNI
jgi:hypothetical protein